VQVSITTIALVTVHWLMRDTTLEAVAARTPSWVLGLILAAMGFLIIITQGAGNAFIYFQF